MSPIVEVHARGGHPIWSIVEVRARRGVAMEAKLDARQLGGPFKRPLWAPGHATDL
jgi:hypothetical protein